MNNIILESAYTTEVSGIKENGNTCEFTATLQEADTKNRNGRIYPRQVLEDAINSPYIKERMNSRSLFGEAGHPLDTSIARQTTIDPRNLAYLIEDIHWENSLIKARCQTCDTAIGRDMMGLIKSNHSRLSFSLRAQGNVKRDQNRDAVVVQSPLMIVTWDWVITPSHQNAVMDNFDTATMEAMFNTSNISNNSAMLNESLNIYENGKIFQINESKPQIMVKDYYKSYNTSKKNIDNIYKYNSDDKIKSMNEFVTITENSDGSIQNKVSTIDFINKSINSKLTETLNNEGIGGIAVLSGPAGVPMNPPYPTGTPDIPADNTVISSKEVIKTISSEKDVGDTEPKVEGKEIIRTLTKNSDVPYGVETVEEKNISNDENKNTADTPTEEDIKAVQEMLDNEDFNISDILTENLDVKDFKKLVKLGNKYNKSKSKHLEKESKYISAIYSLCRKDSKFSKIMNQLSKAQDKNDKPLIKSLTSDAKKRISELMKATDIKELYATFNESLVVDPDEIDEIFQESPETPESISAVQESIDSLKGMDNLNEEKYKVSGNSKVDKAITKLVKKGYSFNGILAAKRGLAILLAIIPSGISQLIALIYGLHVHGLRKETSRKLAKLCKEDPQCKTIINKMLKAAENDDKSTVKDLTLDLKARLKEISGTNANYYAYNAGKTASSATKGYKEGLKESHMSEATANEETLNQNPLEKPAEELDKKGDTSSEIINNRIDELEKEKEKLEDVKDDLEKDKNDSKEEDKKSEESSKLMEEEELEPVDNDDQGFDYQNAPVNAPKTEEKSEELEKEDDDSSDKPSEEVQGDIRPVITTADTCQNIEKSADVTPEVGDQPTLAANKTNIAVQEGLMNMCNIVAANTGKSELKEVLSETLKINEEINVLTKEEIELAKYMLGI